MELLNENNPKEYLKKQSPFLGSEVIGDNIPQPAYDLMPIVITSIVSGVTPVQWKKMKLSLNNLCTINCKPDYQILFHTN